MEYPVLRGISDEPAGKEVPPLVIQYAVKQGGDVCGSQRDGVIVPFKILLSYQRHIVKSDDGDLSPLELRSRDASNDEEAKEEGCPVS
jgi:hypothetical protein